MPTGNCTPTQDAYSALCDLMLPETGSDAGLLFGFGLALVLVGLAIWRGSRS